MVEAVGVGNIISGFLGGMGGNAMIGLSTIACLNGGRERIAPVVTAIGVFLTMAVFHQARRAAAPRRPAARPAAPAARPLSRGASHRPCALALVRCSTSFRSRL